MVLAATRVSRRVTGCDQVFSARARIAVWSAPRAGGELKSEPTTENRNQALRGEFFWQPQRCCSETLHFTSTTLVTHKAELGMDDSVLRVKASRIGSDQGNAIDWKPCSMAIFR